MTCKPGKQPIEAQESHGQEIFCAICSSTDHHLLACSTFKKGLKEDHEDLMRGVITKFGPSWSFCNLEGHFKSGLPQFWVAVADIKQPRHE